MKVIPYPDHWMSYTPMPEMKGKCLGIFAHCFVKSGEQTTIRDIYQNVVDVAVEEKTCTVLSGSQSLVKPNHNLLYEEWTDYDEFFEVQVSRTYRKGFLKWLDPIRSGPISPEFTEIFHSSGEHPVDIASNNPYTLVQSVHITSGREDDARQLFIQHVDDVCQDEQNLFANIHQSINNPQHFLLYEIWSDFSYLIENELRSDRRSILESRFNELIDETMPGPAMELFQNYYDASKYIPAEELF